MSSVRILTADDFEGWRSFVSSMLGSNPKFKIIGEVTDGVDAVQKAQELQPDLILLDIGLPKLNGIEAARQIRDVAPNSTILFLTENYSPDVAKEALRTGASAYVVKSDAGRELLPAVEDVLQGRQFVSDRLRYYEFTAATDDQVSVPRTVNAD